MRNLIEGLFITILVGLVVLGACLFLNPYLLTAHYRTESITVWNVGEELQALILFNFSSMGFISTNYPVEVSTNIRVVNETLLSFLKAKGYVELDISGTFAYPMEYGPLGIYQGSISLQYDGINSFSGKNNIIFPYKGNSYYFSIFSYDSPNDTSPPIYTMNVSDIGKSIPPVFNIDEGYASRAQYENSNRRTGLAIVALSISSFGIMFSISQRSEQIQARARELFKKRK